jgi:hypothetical protein
MCVCVCACVITEFGNYITQEQNRIFRSIQEQTNVPVLIVFCCRIELTAQCDYVRHRLRIAATDQRCPPFSHMKTLS